MGGVCISEGWDLAGFDAWLGCMAGMHIGATLAQVRWGVGYEHSCHSDRAALSLTPKESESHYG